MSKALPIALPSRSGAAHLALLALAALGLGAAAWHTRDWWQTHLGSALRVVDGRLLALALLLNLVYRVINCAGWGLTIRALHRPVSLVESGRLWLTCESLRWLPGSVWSYGSRTALASRLGLSAGFAATSTTLELLLTVLAWALTAAGAGLFSPSFLQPLAGLPWGRLAGWSLLGLVVLAGVAVLVARSPLGAWLSGRLGRRFDWRALLAQRPRLSALVAIVAFYVTLCVFNGLGLWLVLRACPGADIGLAPVVAANAVGWIAGFFAIIAPGGLGVREAGIVGMLATLIPVEQAVLAAALWRAIQMAAELGGLGLALLWPRSPVRP